MGYCTPIWIDDAHWRELFDMSVGRAAPTRARPADTMASGTASASPGTDLIYVSGVLPQGDTPFQWGPTFRLPDGFLAPKTRAIVLESAKPTPNAGGRFTLELLAPDNSVLSSSPFEPIEPSGHVPGLAPQSFFMAIPFSPGATQLRVTADSKEIARVASPGPVGKVTVLSPSSGRGGSPLR
jgi:hypothetical protein